MSSQSSPNVSIASSNPPQRAPSGSTYRKFERILYPSEIVRTPGKGGEGTKSRTRTTKRTPEQVDRALMELKRLILVDGLPDEKHYPNLIPLRPLTWKLLLHLPSSLRPKTYHRLSTSLGQSPQYDKIRNDTFRTLATDAGFKERVGESMLVRLLEAFCWRWEEREGERDRRHAGLPPSRKSSGVLGGKGSGENGGRLHPSRAAGRSVGGHETEEDDDLDDGDDSFLDLDTISDLSFTYVQGMNVLAAPFLYTLPSELEAFNCFVKFIEVRCPLYVQPTLEGVHSGLKLLDTCLEIVDLELFNYLRSKNLSAELYAFPSVLTLCACTPPLDQVLQLWDFLLAYGVHLNVLCVIAQLWLIRAEVLASPRQVDPFSSDANGHFPQLTQFPCASTRDSPMKLLRQFPPLRARECIALACNFLAELPEDVYDKLARHPWDPTLSL